MTEVNEVVIEDEDISGEEISDEELQDDGKDLDFWKAEAKKQSGIAKRRATKLAKLKAVPKEVKKEEVKKDELDLMQLAYLESKGFESEEEIDFIKSAMKRSGDDVRTILKDEFVQNKLKSIKDAKTVLEATPTGTKGAPQSSSKDTVEYWIALGKMPPADKPKLQSEYVNAKMERERRGIKFYNS